MYKFISLVLFSSTLFFSISQAGEIDSDAYILAIENFDSSHSKGLASKGVEHLLMKDALTALHVEDFNLSTIHRSGINYSTSHPGTFITLGYSASIGKYSTQAEKDELADMQAKFNNIVDGCEFHKTEKKFTAGNTSWTTSTSTSNETYYILRSAGCKNTSVTSILASHGIRHARMIENKTIYSESVQLAFNSSTITDMLFIKNELEKNSSLKDFVSKLSTLNRIGIGSPSSTIELVGSSGSEKVGDVFNLKFSKGWGDCPSGCIFRHYWEVEVTPKFYKKDLNGNDRYKFTFVIKESGDKLE